VLLADAQGDLLFANTAFLALHGAQAPVRGVPVAALFHDPEQVRRVFDSLPNQSWRGEWTVATGRPEGLQVAVRAEGVPGRDGMLMGHIIVLTDLRDARLAAEARRQLEASLLSAGSMLRGDSGPPDAVMGAILTNARLAAMDIAEAAGDPSVAPLLQELEASTQRAAALCERLRRFAG
jgi:hypothetical protein